MRVRTVISGLRNLTHIPLGKIAVATIIDIRDPSLVTHLVDVTSSDRHVKFILENVSFFRRSSSEMHVEIHHVSPEQMEI